MVNRVTLYSRAALIALGLALTATVIFADGASTLTGRLGWDFPSFYGAGALVAQGRGADLYNPAAQLGVQAEYLVGEKFEWIRWAYPPYFAVAYAPLSALPYRWAYALHTLLMVAALAGACRMIARIYPGLVKDPTVLFALALTAHPILRAVMAGQNTTLSIFLIVWAWYESRRDRQIIAGIAIGLLFFKPQFALPLAGLFLLSGRWRVTAVALALFAGLVAVGTLAAGPDWFTDWRYYSAGMFESHLSVNIPFIISWLSIANSLFGYGAQLASIVGGLLTAATIAGLSWVWFRNKSPESLGPQIGLASIGIIMLAPITLFYDLGVALVAVIVVAAQMDKPPARLFAFIWVATFMQVAFPSLGLLPAMTAQFTVLGLALIYLYRPASSATQTARP